MRHPIRTSIATIAVVSSCSLLATPVGAAGETVYDSIPSPLPSSLVSLGYQATSTDEFGDHVELDPATASSVDSVTVTFVSWACETGGWNTGDCETTPGATFGHDLTLNIYGVDDSSGQPVPTGLVTTVSQPVDVPYRPSASDDCPDGTGLPSGWVSPDLGCVNGYAFNVSFDLGGATLPADLIYTIAFNTSSHGETPTGVPGGYDSLNVALVESEPAVGTNVDPDVVLWDTSVPSSYTDGGAGGVDTLRADSGWGTYTPAAKFETFAPDPTVEDCKDGGFAALGFRNQGQCVASVVASDHAGT